MDRNDRDLLELNTELLKGMAHPVRLCILRQLIEKPGSCVGDLQLCTSVSQSSVSQHLARLRELGLVNYQRDGNMLYYSVSNHMVDSLIRILFYTDK